MVESDHVSWILASNWPLLSQLVSGRPLAVVGVTIAILVAIAVAIGVAVAVGMAIPL